MSALEPNPRRAAVRLARPEDLPAAAAVFARTFDASVWARMGARSSEAYLRAWTSDPREFMVVAEHPEQGIVGGLLGTLRKDAHRRPVLRAAAPSFGPAFARDLVARPATAVEFARRVASGVGGAVQRRRSPPPEPVVSTFEPQWPQVVDDPGYVAAYWVASEARGQRLATRMCARAKDLFVAQGVCWCDVATYTDNIASQTTALRAGFRLVKQVDEHLHYRMFIGQGAPGDLRVRFDRSPLDAIDLAEHWRALLERTPDASGFHTWPWRRALLSGCPGALVATVFLGDEPVALFPFDFDGHVLRWWGVERSNYNGPLYDPAFMPSVLGGLRECVRALRPKTLDLAGLREHSAFRRAALDLVLGHMGRPHAVRTIACSEIDLSGGWDAVWRRRKKKHRNNWRRALRKLEQLGRVEFEEHTSSAAITAVLDDAIRLYERRWKGFNVDMAFGREREAFVRATATALADEGHAIMNVLRVDGEVIAFSYALRSGVVSNSYTLAHDDDYAPYSPGMLLMLDVLERAARRGDPSFDFSVGDETYKEVWATARIGVHRLVWGGGAASRARRDDVLRVAREQPTLRRLKQEGLRALVPPPAPELRRWAVHRVVAAGTGLSVQPLDLEGMRRHVPADAFRLAIDRVFRGDVTCLVRRGETPIAVVWNAAASRRDGLCRGPADADVYFDPRLLAPIDMAVVAAALGACLFVAPAVRGLPIERSFTTEGDLAPKR